MNALAAGLYVLAYLSAVVDGVVQDKGLYPSSPGRTGWRLFARSHPWILVGAAFGVAATIVALLADG